MDNLGNEVIIKVKEAIRTKLKEMNANNSDEIIDYIMLLVTTKKTNTELAKSIDFVMENNTGVFVKWLSTMIKKLQQVTVSNIEKKKSENHLVSTSKDTTDNEKDQSDDLICDTNDIKFDASEEEKEFNMLNLSADFKNSQTPETKEEEKRLFELNEFKPAKYNEIKVSLPDKSNKKTQRGCFLPTDKIQTKNNILTNEKNITDKSLPQMKNISLESNSKIQKVASKKNISDDIEKVDKRKRPRISINSDDEDEQNVRNKDPITTNDTAKQITKELPKKNNRISMSEVVVKSKAIKVESCEIKKKLLMDGLIVQRIDHQRGALALDTAFKYIQQQIGASDKEIAVVKKWRDYAVDMLRSSKKS